MKLKGGKEVLVPQGKNNFRPTKRMSWDEFFMRMALTAANRTACIVVKAASVFVDDDHKIISIGYNGPSVGDYHGTEVGCAKIHGDPITGEIRRCRGVHSEMNAVINAFDTRRLKGSTLYITVFPCYDCMKVLNNVGIKRIVYYEDFLRTVEGTGGKVKEPEPESRELAIRRGIICEQFRFEEGVKINFSQEEHEIIKDKLKEKSTRKRRS
jgi:dCMP deaminase